MLEGSAREREVDRVSLERGVLQLRAGAQAHFGRAEQAEQRRVVQSFLDSIWLTCTEMDWAFNNRTKKPLKCIKY